jgi:glyoxylase-like metal-dependent hydrolase (beta-lactamase superfamily II)
MWAAVPEARVVFIGDTVTVTEPPYFGAAELDAWLASLDALRAKPYRDYKMVAGRDGLVDRDAVNVMARFLRKIPPRLKRMRTKEDLANVASNLARELMKDFKVPAARAERAHLRLMKSLIHLYARTYPAEG